MMHTDVAGRSHPALDIDAVVELCRQLKEKAEVYKLFARFVGTQRYRFRVIRSGSETDVIENAVEAVRSLICGQCATQFSVVCARLRQFTAGSVPALAFLLKKADHLLGFLAGAYTLFNRMRLDSNDHFDLVFADRIRDWLAPPPERLAELREKNERLLSPMRAIFTALPSANPLPPFRAWFLSRVWATSGTIEFVVPKPYSKTKGAFAATMSDDELWSLWLRVRSLPEDNVVFVKPDETASFRLIVRTSFQTYIKMSYMNVDFSRALATMPEFYTFGTPAQKLATVTRIQDALAAGAWSVNCDGSGWDEGIGTAITQAFFQAKVQRYSFADPDADLQTLWPQIQAGRLSLPNGRVLPYTNGVLSGWGDTLAINSFVNAALMRLANARTNALFWVVQGDDNTTIVRSTPQLDEYAAAYAAVGFKLNRSKSSTLEGVAEFLKMVITPTRASGFPVRSLRAILFGSQDERAHENIYYQRADLWIKYLSRIEADPEFVLHRAHHDISAAVPPPGRMPLQQFREWWLSPRAFGGAGLGRFGFQWRPREEESPAARHWQPPIPVSLRILPVQQMLRGWDVRTESLLDASHRPRPNRLAGWQQSIHEAGLPRIVAPRALLHLRPPGVRFTLPSLRSAFSIFIDGCRRLGEVVDAIPSIAALDPQAAASIRHMLRKYSSSICFAVLKDDVPSAFDPLLSLHAGEMLAELSAPLAQAYALSMMSRTSSVSDLRDTLATLSVRYQ